jgi:hypothetical protein
LNNQGNNSYVFLKDLVYSNGRMTDNINKKLHAHDKMLENINANLVMLSLKLQMLAYMWFLGKSNSTLLEEKKYLLLPLDNPSLMRNRKRKSIRRESR